MDKIETSCYSIALRFIKLLGVVIISLALLGFSIAITSMLLGKPVGDDYGGIATFNHGSWLNEAMKSLATTGRYGQSVTSSILYRLFGTDIVTILPIIAIFWFTSLSYLYINKITPAYIGKRANSRLFSLAAAITFAFFVLFVNNAPGRGTSSAWISFQTFFWPSGIITYTLPLLSLLTGYYLIFLSNKGKRLKKKNRYILYAILLVITSTFNEVQPAVIVAMSVILLLLCNLRPYQKLRNFRGILLINLTSGIIGLAALYFSPGRISRSQAIKTMTSSPSGSLVDNIVSNVNILVNDLYLRPRELVMIATAGIVVAIIAHAVMKNTVSTQQRQKTVYYILPVIITFLVSTFISIILIAIGYGYLAGIYVRTMLISQIAYVLSVSLIAFSIPYILLYKYKKHIYFLAIATGVCFLIFIPNYLGKALVQVNSSVTYYNEWNKQDILLREAASNNKRETVYLNNPAVGLGDGFSLRCTGPGAVETMWLNVQINEYYGGQDRVCLESDRAADYYANQKWVTQ